MQTSTSPLCDSVLNVINKQQRLFTWCAKTVWRQLANFSNPAQLLLTTIANALDCETALATMCNGEAATNQPDVKAITTKVWHQLPEDERRTFTHTTWLRVANTIIDTWMVDTGVMLSERGANADTNNDSPQTACLPAMEAAEAVKKYFRLLQDGDIDIPQTGGRTITPHEGQLYLKLYALIEQDGVKEVLSDVAADIQQSIEAFFITNTQFNRFIEELYKYGNDCGNDCGSPGEHQSTSSKFQNTARKANKSKQKHAKLAKLLGAVMQQYLEQLPIVVDSKLDAVNDTMYMAISHYVKACTQTVHQHKRKREFEHQSKKCRVRHN